MIQFKQSVRILLTKYATIDYEVINLTVYTTTCPAEALAQLLGKKWVPQLIELLAEKPLRFGELTKALAGSTPKVIKQQLSLLEVHGIVHNHKQQTHNQIQSTYELTPTGQALFVIVAQMKEWGSQHLICPT